MKLALEEAWLSRQEASSSDGQDGTFNQALWALVVSNISYRTLIYILVQVAYRNRLVAILRSFNVFEHDFSIEVRVNPN